MERPQHNDVHLAGAGLACARCGRDLGGGYEPGTRVATDRFAGRRGTWRTSRKPNCTGRATPLPAEEGDVA